MALIRCPRCSTTIEQVPGVNPVCPSCGFSSGAGAARAPAAPDAGWGNVQTSPNWNSPSQVQGTGWAQPLQRPGLVTAAGVIGIIMASLVMLAGLLLAFLGGTFAAAFADSYPGVGSLGGGLFMFVGILFLVFGGLYLFVALQALKGRNWARITMIVLSAIGALSAITSLPAGIVGLAVDIFIIVALVLKPSAQWFAATERARAVSPP